MTAFPQHKCMYSVVVCFRIVKQNALGIGLRPRLWLITCGSVWHTNGTRTPDLMIWHTYSLLLLLCSVRRACKTVCRLVRRRLRVLCRQSARQIEVYIIYARFVDADGRKNWARGVCEIRSLLECAHEIEPSDWKRFRLGVMRNVIENLRLINSILPETKIPNIHINMNSDKKPERNIYFWG